jgi:site-specific recombinase XerD
MTRRPPPLLFPRLPVAPDKGRHMKHRTFTSPYEALVRDKNSPFSSFIVGFLAAKTLAPKSKVDYGRYLRDFDEFTGHVNLETALTLDNAARWIDQLRPRGLFAAHNAAMYLKSFAAWIAKSRYIVIPGGGSLVAGLEAPKTPQSHRQAFTDDQLEAIFTVLCERPNRDRIRATAYVRLLVSAGIRRNEARQLALKDVHLERDPKRQSLVRVRAATSKGMKERITRLDPDAVRALDEYINGPTQPRPTYLGPKSKTEPLFLTEAGKAFSENGFGSWAGRISDDIERATGLKWSSHLMRHTWATNYNRGMQYTGNNVYDLKREGGWADLKIPLTYTHDRPEEELLSMVTPIEALRERRVIHKSQAN